MNLSDFVSGLIEDPAIPPGCMLMRTDNDWVLSMPNGVLLTKAQFARVVEDALRNVLERRRA